MRTTALHAAHRSLGAKLVEFGGWEMPISYPTGTIAEHLACRNSAVVFDVSHLGTVRVEGPQAFAALQKVLSNDLRKIAPGKTWTYSDLASRAGSAAAVRAAGTACANNSIMLVVPCHRIVKTGGALGNYAFGVEKKRWLLSHEGYL